MTISHVIYLEFARLIVSQQWVIEVFNHSLKVNSGPPLSQDLFTLEYL